MSQNKAHISNISGYVGSKCHGTHSTNIEYLKLSRIKLSRNKAHISKISDYVGLKCYGIFAIKLFISRGIILNTGSMLLSAFETNIFYYLINTDFYSTNGNACASYASWVILVCGVTRLRTGHPTMWFNCWQGQGPYLYGKASVPTLGPI